MALARLISILTLGAAAVTTGGVLIAGGHEPAGLLLDVLAIATMRIAVEAYPSDS